MSARALALALALACVGSIAGSPSTAVASEGILPSGFSDTDVIENLSDPTDANLCVAIAFDRPRPRVLRKPRRQRPKEQRT